MTDDLTFQSLAETAAQMRQRALSPGDYTEFLLARIAQFNGSLCAFNTVTAERARQGAATAGREIAAGGWRGPLHGMPFGLKDVYETAGILTTGYSRAYAGHVPERDAFCVAKLFEQGAVLLGKQATHELANGGPSFDLPWPPARNPWNTAHITGGSSSGPAAAVAAGLVPAALGTDTGGSIRIPAAMCGVVGLKPTYGLVSRTGVIPHSHSLDHCGPLTRTVTDAALMLSAIAGHDPADPGSVPSAPGRYADTLRADIRGLRIGVVRAFWEERTGVDPEIGVAMNAALDVFTALGAKVEDVRLRPLQAYYDIKNVIAKPEVFAVHRRHLVEQPELFGADFLGLTLPGCLIGEDDYAHAKALQRRCQAEWLELFARHDVLLTCSSGPAPKLGPYGANRVADHWRNPNVETPFSVLGVPAIALPNGRTRSGLPLAMQIAGRPFDEQTVLNAAYAYEQATGWHRLHPALSAVPANIADAAGGGAVALPPQDPKVRDYVGTMTRRAELRLPAVQAEQLCRLAPVVLEAVARVRGTALDG